MTERLVLHVGMHKTGSTAIQNALAATGSGAGWEYLVFKHPNASNILKQAYCGQKPPENGTPQRSYASDGKQARDLVTDRLARTRAELALISGEDLRNIKAANLEKITEACRAGLPGLRRIDAVAYIRAPVSFLHAGFQQRLRNRFFPLSSVQDARRIDYASQFAGLESVLGPDGVSYRPYLRERFPGHSVIADFAEWMQTGPLRESAQSANSSLSGEAVRLLYLWRRAHPRMMAGDVAIITALRSLGGPPLRFSDTLMAPLRPAFEKQAQWAEQRMGWDMSEAPMADAPHSIREEADFEVLAPETLDWLGQRSGLAIRTLRSGSDAVVAGLARMRDRGTSPIRSIPRAWRAFDRLLRR